MASGAKIRSPPPLTRSRSQSIETIPSASPPSSPSPLPTLPPPSLPDAVAETEDVFFGGLFLELEGWIRTSVGNNVMFVQERTKIARGGLLWRSSSPSAVFGFGLDHVDKPHESYIGPNAVVEYTLRFVLLPPEQSSKKVSAARRLLRRGGGKILIHPIPIWVENFQIPPSPQSNPPLWLEFGFEDALRLEVDLAESKFALSGLLLGSLIVSSVRMEIDSIALSLVRVESVNDGPATLRKSLAVAYFELVDGSPIKDEIIPIRLFLSDLPLSPTVRAVHGIFSVKYILNLIVIDAAGRRFYKQLEPIFYRPHPSLPPPDDVSTSSDDDYVKV